MARPLVVLVGMAALCGCTPLESSIVDAEAPPLVRDSGRDAVVPTMRDSSASMDAPLLPDAPSLPDARSVPPDAAPPIPDVVKRSDVAIDRTADVATQCTPGAPCHIGDVCQHPPAGFFVCACSAMQTWNCR